MIKFISVVMLCLLATSVWAQGYTASSIDVSNSVGGGQIPYYTDLGAPTVVSLGDDALSATISPAGFKFYYFGTVYDSFKIGSNGYMIMGNGGTTTSTTPDHGSSPGGLCIAPLWCDLMAASGSATIGYNFSANVLTVEWRDIYQRIPNPTTYWTPAVRMQVILDMASSTVVFRYGIPNAFQSYGATTSENHACAISSSSGIVPPTIVDGQSAGGVSATGAVTTYPENWMTTFSPDSFLPVFLSTPITSGVVGQSYYYDVVVTGNPIPALHVGSSTIPSWLTLLTTSRKLTGTPGTSDIGPHSVVISAVTMSGSSQQSFTVTIAASQTTAPPVITSTAPSTALVGSLYSYNITASGSPAPTFSASGLPSWLSLSGDTISGTPALGDVGSTGTIDVTATNPHGSDTQQFSILVSSTPSAPVITSSPITAAIVGNTYTYPVISSGNPPATISFSGLPTWLTANGGTISGVPGSAEVGQSANITVTATNSAGSDTQVFAITVQVASPPVVLGGGGGGSGCIAERDSFTALVLLLLAIILSAVAVSRRRQTMQ